MEIIIGLSIKVMKKVLMIACLIFGCLLSSCGFFAWVDATDFKRWTFKETIPYTKMNTSVGVRFNGFYEFQERIIVFYKDGYVLISFEDCIKEKRIPSTGRKENLWGEWGKYRLKGDSIVIQYIDNTDPPNLWKFYQKATCEYHGRFENDTTLHIYLWRIHSTRTDEVKTYRLGMRTDSGEYVEGDYVPHLFKFKEYPDLPTSENWLMYDEEATLNPRQE